jgi:hypothetical protein
MVEILPACLAQRASELFNSKLTIAAAPVQVGIPFGSIPSGTVPGQVEIAAGRVVAAAQTDRYGYGSRQSTQGTHLFAAV